MNSLKINNLGVFDFEGDKEPLIFVHAFPLSSKMWKQQVEYFQNKYRVITYDIRGLGESKVSDYQYMMETFVNDFFSVIDKLELETITACGLSMGGYIILRALSKNPERFRAVILSDTKAEADDNDALINRSQSIIQIKNNGLSDFLKNFIKKLITEESYNNQEIYNFLNNIMQEQSPEGICGAQIAIATRTETLEKLKNIKVPALIMVGEKDILIPLEYANNMNKNLRNSDVTVVPGAAHLPNIENPEFFNNAIFTFLKKLR
jgi:pimeloyl-ACP methyl ester carboxylesterase